MSHRINWTQTSSNIYYNFKWKYGPKGVEYKKLAKSVNSLDKQKVKQHLILSMSIITSFIQK